MCSEWETTTGEPALTYPERPREGDDITASVVRVSTRSDVESSEELGVHHEVDTTPPERPPDDDVCYGDASTLVVENHLERIDGQERTDGRLSPTSATERAPQIAALEEHVRAIRTGVPIDEFGAPRIVVRDG
jgi:hypothetical protein